MGGWGGGGWHVPPPWQKPCFPSQNPFKESFSESLSKNESPDTSFGFRRNHGKGLLRWFMAFRILTGIPFQKSKTSFPSMKVNKSIFSESLLKFKTNRMTIGSAEALTVLWRESASSKESLPILCVRCTRCVYVCVCVCVFDVDVFIWKPNRLGVPSYRESHVSGKGVPKSREFNIGMPQRIRQRVP